MKSIKSLFSFLILSYPIVINAQDAGQEFTQQMGSPLYANPAFTGIQQNLRIGFQYRSQLPDLGGGTEIGAFSADLGLPKINSGVGIIFSSYEDYGIASGYAINATFAHELKLSEHSWLRLGLSAGIVQDKNIFETDSINPSTGFIGTTQFTEYTPVIPNFGLGAVYYSDRFYAGVAVNNILRPLEATKHDPDTLDRRVVLQAGYFIDAGKFIINPYSFFVYQGQYNEVLPGVNVSWRKLTVGASYRNITGHSDAVNFLIGLNFGSVKVCYSYDSYILYSSIPMTPLFSHEFSIVLQLNKPSDTSNKPMINHLRQAF